MIRTKGEAGTGNVVVAMTHARLIDQEIKQLATLDDEQVSATADLIIDRYRVLAKTSELQGTPTTPFGSIDDYEKRRCFNSK